ncbi:MAG: hypothetical protein PHY48_15385 [Candidatus Cloacimonetes bacterium]|nr:hypothetical protein [Candidatus Cloacimonadota bacterium]
MNTQIITAALLAKTVSDMSYAVVQKQGGDTVFIEADGLKDDSLKELSISSYRAKHANERNAIVYAKPSSLEVIVNLPNGFTVHGISDADSGSNYLEVAIRHEGKARLDTPLTSSVIHKVDLSELHAIINHADNLEYNGRTYRQGFTPNAKYVRKGLLSGVMSWVRGKSN